MRMNLTEYLDRIHFTGRVGVNVETLFAIHRAHLLNITYENLDIHRGLYVPLDEEHFFTKIVVERRGGWCYEMNGLLAWVLRELGFSVRLLAGSVNRPILGDRATGNHLCLLVHLNQPYLVDVGFGNGILEPLPLKSGKYHQREFTYGLHQERDYWHFSNHPGLGPGFDFTLIPYQLNDFTARCHDLQTASDSGFVRVTVCHRRTEQGYVTLKGLSFRTVSPHLDSERILGTYSEYVQVLRDHFAITLPDSEQLWEKVWTSHQLWMQSQLNSPTVKGIEQI